MIDYLLELNNRILLAINGAHTGFLDTFMMIATNQIGRASCRERV